MKQYASERIGPSFGGRHARDSLLWKSNGLLPKLGNSCFGGKSRALVEA